VNRAVQRQYAVLERTVARIAANLAVSPDDNAPRP
jgi:hypothetical protein